MNYVQLGRTGLRVSPLCLGTMNFGALASEADSHAMMDQALSDGINFFDTADRYGREIKLGYTEEIIGNWFAQGSRRREQVVLATKLYGAMGDGPNDRGLSARHIKQACEDSLRRLQTDYIDLYQMHHIDRNTPWEEIWQGMEQLVREGKILYVGSSNFAGWHIAKANEVAKQRNFMGLVSEQSFYNLTVRTVELEVIPACEDYGVGVIPWSPLGGGILAGRKDKGERRHQGRGKEIQEKYGERLDQWEALCDELGEKPADVALAWLLHNPVVTAPIIGPRTMEQLTGSLRATEIQLDSSVMQRLDEIFPGPGGTAPEAYAW